MRKMHWAAAIFFGVFLSSGLSYANSKIIEELGYKALHEKNYKKALRYIDFLAANGDAMAQYNMGIFYRDGVEVRQDPVEALRWFLKAANNDNMLAQYAAGLAFYKGHGSSADPRAALDYFLDAALNGHATAPLHIGKLFFSGDGVSQNYARAYFWWTLAGDRNVGEARKNLRRITEIMSEEDKREAQKLITKCRGITLKKCLKYIIP